MFNVQWNNIQVYLIFWLVSRFTFRYFHSKPLPFPHKKLLRIQNKYYLEVGM